MKRLDRKNFPCRNPSILKDVRQAGKIRMLKEFGKRSEDRFGKDSYHL